MDYRALLQESLDYIEENLSAELRAAELAKQAGFSLFHYYRLFRTVVGMPVMQYILRRRLLHAVYAIRCGSTGIDAALRFGFDTYAGFYKAFQREFGCPPFVFLRHSRAKRPYRLNLMKEEHMIVTHKMAADILKHWGLEQETISDIYNETTGAKNDSACYVGSSFVLKYTTDLKKLNTHMQLSTAIESTGLRASSPIPTTDGRTFIRHGELYFYLTKRLGTRMTAPQFYQHDRDAAARFTGEIIGQLHLALAALDCSLQEAELYETVRDWALPKVRTLLPLTDAFCAHYLEVFEALYPALPRQIIHRDPNPGNVILCEEGWGFIDFELSERNVRIYDPCYAASAILSESFPE
ncbi:MAG: helix-turn-helix domain-containing protein, partial [Oscillospiraceae bacterium]|nr:helix-turn-helix domain-containing protein [Oscillospiraceae bacterium]